VSVEHEGESLAGVLDLAWDEENLRGRRTAHTPTGGPSRKTAIIIGTHACMTYQPEARLAEGEVTEVP